MALHISERCLLLVGGVVCLFMLLSFQSYNQLPKERLLQIQEQRKAHLEEVCGDVRGTLDQLSNIDLNNFIVDDKHDIIYCYIPKVACTNWKRVMYVLNQSEPYPDPLSMATNIHKYNMLTLLSSFPRAEIKARLKHYTKFLFVRDPFVRLISAYKDKFYRHNEDFYLKYGLYMLKKYAHMPNPPDTEDEAFMLGIRPTFQHFVQYLLDPMTEEKTSFEPHWRQMHRLCHPCTIQYDFIGHQETLEEDANLLLKMLKLDEINFPSPPKSPTNTDSLWDWFRAVPLEDRRRLYTLYEEDYRLFGYPKPQSLLDGQEDKTRVSKRDRF